ncbi:MAG: tRNA 2-thiouridine(34) synthase MnmA, partial [Nitrospira sp.]|nr:tRNA 2-thiouridine(34) synthase MnmA [Nitrospira sp.]
NTVMLGPEESLYRSTCDVSDLNLFTSSFQNGPTDAEVKVRYATPTTPATIYPLNSSTLRIQFHKPQRALSPGQSAVFYQDNQVLGGGIIQPF